MPKPKKSEVPAAPPTPAARVVRGVAFAVARRPEGIASPATEALQSLARAARSQQPQLWGVFPAFGRDAVVAGYLSARTPRRQDVAWAVEPGAALAREHLVVGYTHSEGAPVGPLRDERYDLDCVEDFIAALSSTDAWRALGATPLDAASLPGGERLESPHEPAYYLITDDGRGADVVFGMSFWRAGDAYDQGRVRTWARPVGDDDTVRVVGVRAARVDREAPLRVAPPVRAYAFEEWEREAERETRATLDSQRSFGWYFIADEGG